MDSLGAVRVIHEVAHRDEGVTQGFCRRDPLLSVQTEHPLQQIYELSSVGFLSQHVRPLQMRRQVDLGFRNKPQISCCVFQ